MGGENEEFLIQRERPTMALLERQEILIVFASFIIGSAAGWWSRMQWGNSLIAVASTFIGIVVGYYILLAALRVAGHPVE